MAGYHQISVLLLLGLLAACSSVLSDKESCEVKMQQAWDELKEARLTGPGSAWQVIKASKFLAQAKVKYETERYELCLDKVDEARRLLQQLEE